MDRQVDLFRGQIREAAAAVGLNLGYRELQRLVARAVRDGHIRNALARLRAEARYPRTVSTFARRIGPGYGDPLRAIEAGIEPKRLQFEDKDVDMTGTVFDPNSGAYNQRKRVRDSTGQARSKDDRKLAMLGAHMQTFIDRFQGVNAPIWSRDVSETAGHYALSYKKETDLSWTLPVHTYDLTLAYQNKASQYNISNEFTFRGCPGMVLKRLPTTNDFSWSVQNGTRSDGVTDDPRWIVERTPIALSAPQDTTYRVGDKGYIQWVDIRMMLYGAVKTPTTVTVQLVRLLEMCPDVYGYSNSATSTTLIEQRPQTDERPQYEEYNDMWLGHIDRLIGNPIAKRGTKKPCMQVLYSKRFEFEPQMSTEEDKTPHAVEFNLRYSVDKVIDYVRNVEAFETMEGMNLDDAAFFVPEDFNKTSICCDKRGRVFLMVTGEVPKDQSILGTGEKLGDYCPSYDVILRRKHAFLTRQG